MMRVSFLEQHDVFKGLNQSSLFVVLQISKTEALTHIQNLTKAVN